MTDEAKKLMEQMRADIFAALSKFENKDNNYTTKTAIEETLSSYIRKLQKDAPKPSEKLIKDGGNNTVIVDVRAMAEMLFWYESNEQTRAELMFKKLYGQNALENVQSVGFSPEGDWQVKFLHPVEYFLVTLETSKDGVKVVKS